jgi:lipid-binding SYLF domain-containing protein
LRIDGKDVAYYSLSSASVGLTLGLAKHKEVILFMNQEVLDKFMNSAGWSIGADTGVAVLSQGGGGNYDTQTLQRPILAFVFGEKGLIGDASVEGTKINKLDR